MLFSKAVHFNVAVWNGFTSSIKIPEGLLVACSFVNKCTIMNAVLQHLKLNLQYSANRTCCFSSNLVNTVLFKTSSWKYLKEFYESEKKLSVDKNWPKNICQQIFEPPYPQLSLFVRMLESEPFAKFSDKKMAVFCGFFSIHRSKHSLISSNCILAHASIF